MGGEKAQESGLSVEGQFASIPDVLAVIKSKIASMKSIETTKFKTSMNLGSLFGDLKQEKKEENLIKAFSYVSSKAKAYAAAAADLGRPTGEFTEAGSTVEEWKHDIGLQILIVNHKEELEKLKALEKEASTFLSQEDQKSIFLAKLMSSIGQ